MNTVAVPGVSSNESDPDRTSAVAGAGRAGAGTAGTGDVCTDVVLAIADEVNLPPERLTPPLYDFVDPDALAALCRDGRFDGRVAFAAYGCTVVVDADGTIEVDGAE